MSSSVTDFETALIVTNDHIPRPYVVLAYTKTQHSEQDGVRNNPQNLAFLFDSPRYNHIRDTHRSMRNGGLECGLLKIGTSGRWSVATVKEFPWRYRRKWRIHHVIASVQFFNNAVQMKPAHNWQVRQPWCFPPVCPELIWPQDQQGLRHHRVLLSQMNLY